MIDLTENQLVLFLSNHPELEVSIRYSEGEEAGCGVYSLAMVRSSDRSTVKREMKEPLCEDLLSDILEEMSDIMELGDWYADL